MGIVALIATIISTRVVVLRKWRHLTLDQNKEQGKLMGAVNSRNKGPKNASFNYRNRLKTKKMNFENLITVALKFINTGKCYVFIYIK